MNLDWVNILVTIFSSLAIIIPLGVKLYHTVVALVQEKNWAKLISHLTELMAQAEDLFEQGASKKLWVLDSIEVIAEQINYPLTDTDKKIISNLIDEMCAMTKKVNVSLPEEELSK